MSSPNQGGIALQLPPSEVYRLACSHLSEERLDSAEAMFLALLQQIPGEPRVLGMLGALRLKQNRLEEAVALCSQANSAEPASPLHKINLASALAGLQRTDEALVLLRQTCADHPEHVMAHYNLGNFLRETQQTVAALEAYQAVLTLDPKHLSAMNNMATLLIDLGRYEEAQTLFNQVLAIDASNANAAGNRALLAATQGDHASAVELYKQVPPSTDIKLSAGVRFNQSLSMIRVGNYEQGFPLYEWRWKGSPTLLNGYRYSSERQWRGEPLQGRRLLVWGEQGFGDTLQFVRYLPLVAARQPARLALAAHPALLRLFRQSLPMVEVLDRETLRNELESHWDYHCPIMSLALATAHPEPVRKSQVPRQVPYLRADAAEVARWENRLASTEPSRPLRVGLSWLTGQTENGGRSFELKETGPLMNLPGVRFYRLTRAEPTRTTEATPEGLELFDFSSDLKDFASTAAFMHGLDLVLSVDTSVLHIAGALGLPTLGLYPTHGGNFFDVEEGQQTWYPSVTVWRQRTMGDWNGLLQRVAQRLLELRAQQTPDTAPGGS